MTDRPEDGTAYSAAPGPSPLAGPDLVRAVEALLVVTDAPLRADEVARAWEVQEPTVRTALTELARCCVAERRGYVIRETATGWRMYAADDLSGVLRAAVVGEVSARLSPAALETLAVVAYRQPVSRSRVAAIRGVSVDAVMRTLASRGLVTDTGVDPVSGATLYVTTELFLELTGLQSLEEMPELAPLLPEVSEMDAADV